MNFDKTLFSAGILYFVNAIIIFLTLDYKEYFVMRIILTLIFIVLGIITLYISKGDEK